MLPSPCKLYVEISKIGKKYNLKSFVKHIKTCWLNVTTQHNCTNRLMNTKARGCGLKGIMVHWRLEIGDGGMVGTICPKLFSVTLGFNV